MKGHFLEERIAVECFIHGSYMEMKASGRKQGRWIGVDSALYHTSEMGLGTFGVAQ